LTTATTDERFTEEQRIGDAIANRAVGGKPTFTSLKRHLERFGPDGILDSAVHLPEDQYERLEQMVKRYKPVKRVRGRKTVTEYVRV
jgi:hypothetical protein